MAGYKTILLHFRNGYQQQQRGSEILDEDARRMLKDCQEYLLGAFDHLTAGDRRRQQQQQGTTSSAEHSPLNTIKPPLGQRSGLFSNNSMLTRTLRTYLKKKNWISIYCCQRYTVKKVPVPSNVADVLSHNLSGTI